MCTPFIGILLEALRQYVWKKVALYALLVENPLTTIQNWKEFFPIFFWLKPQLPGFAATWAQVLSSTSGFFSAS